MSKPLMPSPDMSAHEILESHITNVPEITARVIRAALAEHAALLSHRDRESAPLGADLRKAMLVQLRGIAEALQLFDNAVAGIQNRVRELTAEVMKPSGSETNGSV